MKICADDFGQSDEINEGILRLVRAGRLDAVSVLTVFAGDPHAEKELSSFRGKDSGQIQIGLHFVLTGWGRPSYFTQLFRAFFGKISSNEIENELQNQIAEFNARFGFDPDYVDGHEHVHLLPGVSQALVAVISQWPPGRKPWVRVPGAPEWARWPKSLRGGFLFLRNLGLLWMARPLKALLKQASIRSNRFLFGFVPAGDLHSWSLTFELGLRLGSTDEDWFFCHPGLSGARLDELDRIEAARPLRQTKSMDTPVLLRRPDLEFRRDEGPISH